MQSSTGYPELDRLRTYRLDHDLSYRQLAARVGIAYRTLYALLAEPNPRPWDRTLHKIRAFLDAESTVGAGAPGAGR